MLALAGCSSPAPAPLASVAIVPSSATLTPGDVVRFSAEGRDASGKPLRGIALTWSSSAPDVAAVSGWGVALGVARGTARIAVASGAFSASAAVTVDAPLTHALIVIKSGGGAGAVTSSPAGIDCGSSCNWLFTADAPVTLTAAPQAGSRLAFWGGDCSGSAATCPLVMSAGRQVEAHFSPLGNTALSVAWAGAGSGTIGSAPVGLSCSGPPCSASFPTGSRITLTAQAAAGSLFDGWNGACSGTGPCTITLDSTPTLGATFSLAPRMLTASVAGNGSITSSPPGIACPGACSASFPANVAVTLTAAPGSGWFLKGWSGACSGTSACSVTMSAAASVSAIFVQHNALDLTLSGTGKGTVTSSPPGIDCGTTCSATFDSDVSVTLTAAETPGTFSRFGGWQGACSGTSPSCTLSMDAPRAATAAFDPIPAEVARAITFGTAGDEGGTAIAIAGGAAFVVGNGPAGGLIARYALPLAPGASPVWSSTWPSSGGSGADVFSSVAATASAVYVAGQSYSQTDDTYGSKEQKPILLKYSLSGTAPTWYSWYILEGFSGPEWFDSVAVSVESGSTYLYTTGYLPFSPDRHILFKAKDPGTTGSAQGSSGTQGYAPQQSGFPVQIFTTTSPMPTTVLVASGAVYATAVWGGSSLLLDKYDSAGAQVWEQRFTSTPGVYRALAELGGAIYAAGYRTGASNDFLVEKWSTSGVQAWSRAYDRGGGDDQLFGVVGIGARIYAVGRTNGGTAGGYDAAVLQIDPANGDLLSTTLYGGAGNDAARGAATDGTRLYVVGDTRSAGAGGSDLLLLEMTVPQ